MKTTEELIERALKTGLSSTEQNYALTAIASALNDIAKALNKNLENKEFNLEQYKDFIIKETKEIRK